MIDSKFARKLGLRGKTVETSLQGLYGGVNRVRCERTSFVVKGHFGERKIEHALIVPSLDLPRQSLSKSLAQRIKEQENIELQPYRDEPLRILFITAYLTAIGQDNWPLIMSDQSRRLAGSGLVVSHSQLGWSVHGYLEDSDGSMPSTPASATCFFNNEQPTLERLERTINEYIELDNFGVTKAETPTDENERAWAILEATSRKRDVGWETGLLWKEGLMPDSDSKATAERRLYSLERKLDKNPIFAARYYHEMDRLIANGYAIKVENDLRRPREWFVPHFGVENVNKPDKVRLVCDAAAKTRGKSMNDFLETGPDLLQPLPGPILRFRQYPVAVKADIKDMYLRVGVIDRDRGAQRFLWRGSDRHRSPDIYENTSLIFGSASSPCSAISIKNKNAEQFSDTKPEAVKSIIKNSYMDDYLASRKTVAEMQERVRDVISINEEANFHMHGWESNEPSVVAGIRDEDKSANGKQSSLCKDTLRVLGLYWDLTRDELSFNTGLDKIRADFLLGKVKPTKREFFSVAMSVYDPLGIIAPFTLQAKFIMQDIWGSGVNWDSRIRDEEFKAWCKWLKNLEAMRQCRIPRCLFSKNSEYANSQLHVFCDASDKAFAAVAYLRSETPSGTIYVALIMSKSRVTSKKKQMSIPRLELQAEAVEREIEIKVSKRVFWSDSTTVLHWIRGEPRTKQMFVANRLGEIAEATKTGEWRWVPTKLNPADDATRKSNTPMRSNDRWFTGPDYLHTPIKVWPKEETLQSSQLQEINELEARKEYIGAAFTKSPEKCVVPIRIAILGWARITRLMERVRDYFYTWYRNYRARKERRVKAMRKNKRLKISEPLPPRNGNEPRVEKLLESEKAWYREIQSSCFPREMEAVAKGEKLPRGCKFIGLHPYIDNEGLLRARGRVSKFQSTLFQNLPIILDANHFATKLLIAAFHRRYDHANNETVINELRQHFYIVGLRTRLRFLAKDCSICRLRRAMPVNPQMADLPRGRIAYRERPFTHCGIDYFGPMLVKIGRRREKRWGVLFTCLTTRAVHLELAPTLSASSAIMALQRMAGRRGFPRHIYSDNGTNFVRANKELKEAIRDLDTVKLGEFATANRFTWHFNPPDAAHMGRAWERMIRSVKAALNHTLAEKVPSEEVLSTLFIEIEHMINSRPLTHVSVDPDDEEALTPNHFLIGSSSGLFRFEKYEAEVFEPRKSFELAQHLANGFWKRWLREYLPTLLPRQKWNTAVPTLQVGDIVLITDYQTPRNTWRKGKVMEVLPNKSDNIVRVVKVRTGKKDFIRPVNKLIGIFGSTS